MCPNFGFLGQNLSKNWFFEVQILVVRSKCVKILVVYQYISISRSKCIQILVFQSQNIGFLVTLSQHVHLRSKLLTLESIKSQLKVISMNNFIVNEI